jgi:hypothetical protein
MAEEELRFSPIYSRWLNEDGTDGPLKLAIDGKMGADATNKHISKDERNAIGALVAYLLNQVQELEQEHVDDTATIEEMKEDSLFGVNKFNELELQAERDRSKIEKLLEWKSLCKKEKKRADKLEREFSVMSEHADDMAKAKEGYRHEVKVHEEEAQDAMKLLQSAMDLLKMDP